LILAFCEELRGGRCVAVKNEGIGLFVSGAFFRKGAVDFLVVPLGFAGVLSLAFGFSGAGYEVFLIALVCEGEGFSVTASFAAGKVEPAAARRVEALVFLCGAVDEGAIDDSSSKCSSSDISITTLRFLGAGAGICSVMMIGVEARQVGGKD